MKQYIPVLLFVLAFAAPAFAKSYINGIDANYPPFAYVDENSGKPAGFDVRLYDSAPRMIEDVINGRIHAALMDSLPAEDAASKGKPVRISGTHGAPVHFGVACRKEDTELQKLVSEGYAKLMAAPFWVQLQQKYGVKPLD